MAAIDAAQVSKFLNATLPTATGAKPTQSFALLANSAMYIALTSTTNVAGAGTQQTNGSGYTTNGLVLATAATASSAGSSVLFPISPDVISWTAGSTWSIYGLNITDGSQVRTWYGNFNGFPIAIASGNTFLIASSAITVSLS